MDGSDHQLVIVALPEEDDLVRKYSSEKEPHLTLLHLGTPNLKTNELSNIILYLAHAASQLHRFSLDVERRDELGDKKADVLFFKTRWSPEIVSFRDNLLKNEFVNRSYLTSDQFPQWLPHLTMGYPETPAKIAKDEHTFYSVRFDRIAIWTEDYEGPTFPLKTYDYDMEVAMSDLQQTSNVSDILEHYGVKGMKWGVRRSQSELNSASDPDSADVAAVKKTKKKIASNSGKTDSISNKDLQDLINRTNLEQQYSKIKKDQASLNKGHKKVKELLEKSRTLNEIYNVLNSPLGKSIRKALIGV